MQEDDSDDDADVLEAKPKDESKGKPPANAEPKPSNKTGKCQRDRKGLCSSPESHGWLGVQMDT